MKLTIFTPTYNRAHLLPRLYESLKNQSCKDFEWLIVDDGSGDHTQEVVRGFVGLDVKYIKQENGGKHRAINRGIGVAQGEYFMIVDSDDYLSAPNVVGSVVEHLKQLQGDGVVGLLGNKVFENNSIIGNHIERGNIVASLTELREKHGLQGDKEEVILTSVMQEFLFDDISGENFSPEGAIWNRLSLKYKVSYCDEHWVTCSYLPGGLSDSLMKLRRSCPVAFLTYYSEYCAHPTTGFANKIKRSLLYWAIATRSGKKTGRTYMIKHFFYTLPLGWLLAKIGKV